MSGYKGHPFKHHADQLTYANLEGQRDLLRAVATAIDDIETILADRHLDLAMELQRNTDKLKDTIADATATIQQLTTGAETAINEAKHDALTRLDQISEHAAKDIGLGIDAAGGGSVPDNPGPDGSPAATETN